MKITTYTVTMVLVVALLSFVGRYGIPHARMLAGSGGGGADPGSNTLQLPRLPLGLALGGGASTCVANMAYDASDATGCNAVAFVLRR